MATPRTINFYDSYTPSLTDGKYQIDIHQDVQKDGQSISHSNQNGDQFSTITQYFQVHGPRFSLDPSFVHASHPPNGASGQFENELAHVSLNRLILPWEVLLKPGAEGTPWLALLIFAEGELPDDPHAQGLVNTSYTVNDLLTLNDPNVRGPKIATDSVIAEVLQSTCRTIDVPSQVFTGVVPRFDELPYLAHVREVTETPSLLAKSRMSLDELTDVGQYSVVVANRFPRTTGNYAAHLVSLEGFVDCLTSDGGPQVPGGQPTVRLVSLMSWSFSSQTEDGGHFSQRVHALALPGEPPSPDAPHALSLRLSPPADASTDEAREVQRRLEWGYVPLSYLTAEGEETFAWYRGPLTPVPPPPLPPGLTPPTLARAPQAHAAQDEVTSPSTTDGLLVYIKDWGVFDLSYAVAWMTGWQMGLSHAQARTAQKAFWRKARSTAATIFRRLTTPSDISGLDPEALTTAEALAHPQPATHRLHTLVEGGLGQRLTRQRPQRSTAVTAADAGAPLSRAEQMRALVQRSEVREMLAHALEDETAQVGDVLDSLGALDMIPFDHLVADQRMLPVESVRFFYTDSTWITALADGFASAGAQSDVDKALHETVLAQLRAEANTVSWPKAGLLLRSRLASDWPGMIIDAEKNNSPVQIVRREYLAPDLLLCLFEDIPDVVNFSEPHQDLYFGAEIIGDGLWLYLRHLTSNSTGGIIANNDTFPAQGTDSKGLLNYLRAGSSGAGTLDIHKVVPDLSQALRTLGELTGTLSSSDFAVEFIQSPSRQTFKQP
ncbi:hypothetical protein ACIBKX_32660 [Streptomyces sp. NPDC050658]|uniref:hypothetical protein n=1 Tax=unclassified Streptomyces TaxID=2593676 RepID=UPI00342DE6F9